MTNTAESASQSELARAQAQLQAQINQLGNIHFKLFSFPIVELFRFQPLDERLAFDRERDQFSLAFKDLRNKQLLRLSSEFAALSQELQTGINRLQGEIDALESTVEILNAIGAVFGTARRIITLLV
jgi:hypothetical protein